MLDTSFLLPGNLSARLTSDVKELVLEPHARMLFRAYVPGLEVSNAVIASPDFTIRHKESDARKLVRGSQTTTIFDAWNGQVPFDIYHILYGLTRLELLKKGLYPVHSVCVRGKSGNVLIVGHSGSGKSTTALELVQSAGMTMVSGNKTVIKFSEEHRMQVVAGTPTMTIRESDRKRYSTVIGENVSYYNRLAFELKPEQYTTPTNEDLVAVVVVLLNDGIQDCSRVSPDSAAHKLYPYYLDAVNADTLVCGNTAVLDGTPTHEAKVRLATGLGKALQHTPVYSVVGSLAYVSRTISNL